jgi:light-regulated signal transduction histidine kinase (bacteriophytochrome)
MYAGVPRRAPVFVIRFPSSRNRAKPKSDTTTKATKTKHADGTTATADQVKKAQQDLARSNQDLEQFAYVASHDLQEPLRMVATYTQLLAERYHGQLDANADKYIQYAVDGALRMQTLVQDLLTFSRVGRQDTDLQSINCNGVVAMAMKNLQAAISESGAQILCDPLPVICGDSSQLQQVFQNLIGNALKFQRETVPQVHIGVERKGNEWQFAVRDNGIGIAPNNRSGGSN